MFIIEVVAAIVNLILGFLINQIEPLQLKLLSISFSGLSQLRLFNFLYPEIGIGFWFGNIGNLDSCSS